MRNVVTLKNAMNPMSNVNSPIIEPSPSSRRRINPLIPESVGGLLVEEWTIDPHSTLPSFLEMAMIEESQRVAWSTLKSIISYLQHRIHRWSQDSLNGESTLMRKLWSRLGIYQMAHYLSENVLASYSPEIRLGIVYFLERRSLLSGSAALISEVLHGGRRVKLGNASSNDASQSNDPHIPRQARRLILMSKQDGIRLAVVTALGLYLLERGEWLHRHFNDHPKFTWLSPRLRKFLNFLYPFLYSSAKGLNLWQRWQFLLGQSVYFDSFSKWLSLIVRRVVADDTTPNPDSNLVTPSVDTVTPNDFFFRPILNSPTFQRIFVATLTSMVGISWVARLQLLRRQYRRLHNFQRGYPSSPSPPEPLPTGSVPIPPNLPPTHCPLCRSPRINPTASTSGYVFCFSCLTAALRSRPLCPITGKKCPESSIIRLFEPHSI